MSERQRGDNPIATAWDISQAARLGAAVLGIKLGGIALVVIVAAAALLGALMSLFAVVIVQARGVMGDQTLAIPGEQLEVMLATAQRYGVPWQVLAAMARVESDFGRNMGPSSAGAIGYCQFLPETWAAYGRDEDGDGVADPTSFRDCIPAMARFLLDHGWRNDDLEAQRQALHAYNHEWTYVERVLIMAAVYGLGGRWQGGLRWPVPGHYGISSFFGQVDEARGPAPHTGIDIAAPQGTEVVAAGGGVVQAVTRDRMCGLGVVIAHGQGLTTVYCHLSEVRVWPSLRVAAGQPLGAVGNTGQSTGPHLHFGVLVGGRAVDPLLFLNPFLEE
jgi:flagellar biosynthesis protein FliQ